MSRKLVSQNYSDKSLIYYPYVNFFITVTDKQFKSINKMNSKYKAAIIPYNIIK